jgi:hypothetical protein
MAKRFTDTELWDKEWFMKLPPRLKCLVKMVRDKCDLAGIWSPNWTIANTYVGEPVTEKELLSIDGGEQFVKIGGGKIVCVDFVRFQYGQLSEKSPVHRKVISLLSAQNIDYKYPIYSPQDKEEEKDKDKEVEEEEEKEEDKETETVTAQIWPTFDDFWREYDNSHAKKKCKAIWMQIKQPEREKIMSHVPDYVKSTPDKKFRKHPLTYLKNESWNDEIITSNESRNSKTGKGNYATGSDLARETSDSEILAEVARQNGFTSGGS